MITKIRGGRHKGEGWMERVYVRVAACVFIIVWPQHIVFIRLKALWYRCVWTTTVLKWCDRLWSHKDNSRSKTSNFIQSQWSHITPILLQEQLENVSGLTDIAVHTFTLTTHLLDFWGNQQKIGVRELLIELIWLNIARTIGSAVAELLLSSWRCITLRHNCRSLKLHIYCRLQLLLTTTRSEKTETALHRWNTELQGSSSTHPSWSI